MERVTISLEENLLDAFDSYLARRGYANRSEGLRDVLREFLATDTVAGRDEAHTPCVGCVVYVYNHTERALSSRLVEAQHHHHDIPRATLHMHIDPENCLEATVLEGTVAEVRAMADKIITQTGVRHGHLHVIPAEGATLHDHGHHGRHGHHG